MNAAVQIGSRRGYQLREVIAVYANDSMHASNDDGLYALRHPVGSRGALGAGQQLTVAFLQALMQGLGSSLQPELLPENVLCRTPQVICWWTAAQRRPLFFLEKSELGGVSGKHFPLPALVWKTIGGELYIRALRENCRPAATTKLCGAPFWNTDTTGLVCQGSMRKPTVVSAETLAEWEEGYFGAQFTHVFDRFGRGGAVAFKGGAIALWKSLASTRTSRVSFPVRVLRDAGETLEQFVKRGDRNDA